MKKIAIVGANSYIARNVLFTLQQDQNDYEIFLYDAAPSHVDGGENYTSIDLMSQESVKNMDLNCDCIFMFVGKTGSANGFDDFNVFIDVNEKMLLGLLNEYRRQKSAAKIIFPSTRLVYKGMPGALKETAEKEFKTIYAINKYACEQYLLQYNKVFGIQYCIFRICIPYGTLIPNASSYGTAEFMLSKAMKGENISLYGKGEVRRTLTYMGDLCNALIAGAFSDACSNDIFNIGGEDYSLEEMATLISKQYNVGVEYVDWPEVAWKIESGDTVFDSEKFDSLNLAVRNMKFSDWCKLQ